jgi:hypothetical protein
MSPRALQQWRRLTIGSSVISSLLEQAHSGLARRCRDAPVLHRLVVAIAESFEELAVGKQIQHVSGSPWFQERLGIVDGDRQLHVANVDAPEALGHAERVAVRPAL